MKRLKNIVFSSKETQFLKFVMQIFMEDLMQQFLITYTTTRASLIPNIINANLIDALLYFNKISMIFIYKN